MAQQNVNIKSATTKPTAASAQKITEGNMNPRQQCTVIVSQLDTGLAFHFCAHPLLSGSNSNLWFPLMPDMSVFEAVERVMVMNHQAVNVTNVETVRVGGRYADCLVTYNAILPKSPVEPEDTAQASSSEKVNSEILTLIDTFNPTLQAGVTVAVVNTNIYGDQLIEICRDGVFEWRAWTFEPGFKAELERSLRFYQR